MSTPAYRYLEPVPAVNGPARGICWGLVLAVPLWLVIFAVGFLVAHLT